MVALVPDFHPTLLAIESLELDDVQPFLLPRSTPRKMQAVAARSLFKQLGLKDISVTTPTWSMASSVIVRLPRMPWTQEIQDEWTDAFQGGHQEGTTLGQLRSRGHRIDQKLQAILDKAFPQHVDRSNPIEDRFDSCWSIY